HGKASNIFNHEVRFSEIMKETFHFILTRAFFQKFFTLSFLSFASENETNRTAYVAVSKLYRFSVKHQSTHSQTNVCVQSSTASVASDHRSLVWLTLSLYE